MKRNIPSLLLAGATLLVFLLLLPTTTILARATTTPNLIAGISFPAKTQTQEKSVAQAPKADLGSTVQAGDCALIPYNGTPPLNQLLPDPVPSYEDFRGGMICKYVINAKLPPFIFHFVDQGNNALGRIEISEMGSNKVIQVISNPVNPYFSSVDPYRLLNTLDANFDGYNDLTIGEGCGVTGNCQYDFFLYEPAKKQFVRNSFLSNLSEPQFDPYNKEVNSYSNMSAFDWEHDIYQFQNGQYVLIRKVVASSDRKNNTSTLRTYELKNGKMELTDSTTQ
ncbi:MAG TPA: hypothetical protein VGX94_15890 [Terriglobia bacterium]|nr:hypothetical protein [Terriglobia bacterium]